MTTMLLEGGSSWGSTARRLYKFSRVGLGVAVAAQVVCHLLMRRRLLVTSSWWVGAQEYNHCLCAIDNQCAWSRGVGEQRRGRDSSNCGRTLWVAMGAAWAARLGIAPRARQGVAARCGTTRSVSGRPSVEALVVCRRREGAPPLIKSTTTRSRWLLGWWCGFGLARVRDRAKGCTEFQGYRKSHAVCCNAVVNLFVAAMAKRSAWVMEAWVMAKCGNNAQTRKFFKDLSLDVIGRSPPIRALPKITGRS